jgi:hypothetical protein
MKYYTLNAEGERQVMAFLDRVARPEVFEYAQDNPSARAAWFEDAEFSINNGITPEGHLEVGGFDTKSKNPETCTFWLECYDEAEID